MILVRQMLSTGKVERLYLLTVGTEKVLSATIWCQVRMVATVLSDLKITVFNIYAGEILN